MLEGKLLVLRRRSPFSQTNFPRRPFCCQFRYEYDIQLRFVLAPLLRIFGHISLNADTRRRDSVRRPLITRHAFYVTFFPLLLTLPSPILWSAQNRLRNASLCCAYKNPCNESCCCHPPLALIILASPACSPHRSPC